MVVLGAGQVAVLTGRANGDKTLNFRELPEAGKREMVSATTLPGTIVPEAMFA